MCNQCDKRPETFKVPQWTVAQVKAAIPDQLFERSTRTGLQYLARDVFILVLLGVAAWKVEHLRVEDLTPPNSRLGSYVSVSKVAFWCLYWWFQSLTFTALWVLAHECGHGAFSPSPTLCDAVGFVLHSFLGTPYYSWKYSHRQHHRYNGHMDKDEHWIPPTQDKPTETHGNAGFMEIIEDTPLFQIVQLIVRQPFGFQAYLLCNASGQPSYPRWTNHINPFCILFRPDERAAIIASDLGIGATLCALYAFSSHFGYSLTWKLYGVPWLLLSHWISMIVFLQHTDPLLPHYRNTQWTFSRGALVTMDRPFLGWQGSFFFHNVAHYHVVHHFFPKMPFYHAREATEYVKGVLGPDYYTCKTPVFKSLWQNYLRCRYVDTKGDVVFYKDKAGRARVQDTASYNQS